MSCIIRRCAPAGTVMGQQTLHTHLKSVLLMALLCLCSVEATAPAVQQASSAPFRFLSTASKQLDTSTRVQLFSINRHRSASVHRHLLLQPEPLADAADSGDTSPHSDAAAVTTKTDVSPPPVAAPDDTVADSSEETMADVGRSLPSPPASNLAAATHQQASARDVAAIDQTVNTEDSICPTSGSDSTLKACKFGGMALCCPVSCECNYTADGSLGYPPCTC